MTSDHNHHNHWRTNWRTAKYGVTNLAPLPTDQMPIITTLLNLISGLWQTSYLRPEQTTSSRWTCMLARSRWHFKLCNSGETICNANFLLDFENVVIKFVKKISQLWKLLKPFAVQTLHSHSFKSLVSPLWWKTKQIWCSSTVGWIDMTMAVLGYSYL